MGGKREPLSITYVMSLLSLSKLFFIHRFDGPKSGKSKRWRFRTFAHISHFTKEGWYAWRKVGLTCSASSFSSNSMIKRSASGNKTTTSFSAITFWTCKPWKLIGWLSPHPVWIKRTNSWSKWDLRCSVGFSIMMIKARHRGTEVWYWSTRSDGCRYSIRL